jgi:N-acetylglucosamine-6-phosphate deacetylase
MRYAITNCDIYSGEKVLYDKGIIVNGKIVEAISDTDKIPRDLEVIDLNGLNIAPGFIDLQVNGGGGVLFNDNPTEECISQIFEGHKRFGTTNFLPTLITASKPKMLQAIESVKSCISKNKYGVIGMHLEGPYINQSKAGVHDKNFIRSASLDELRLLIEAGKNVIKLFTLAPELIKEEHIEMLKRSNIIISVGHTKATYEETLKAFNAGFSKVTHLFNAMSQFEGREPGVVGAAMESKDVWAGIIADGFHVHFGSIKISKRMKGTKLLLVTDAMPPVGSNNMQFKLGDLNITCRDGRCTTEDGILAGSALDMATAVRNCIQKVGIPMDEALRMASTYPAECLGINNVLGNIMPGYLANMVIFDNQLNVKAVVSDGCYEKV